MAEAPDPLRVFRRLFLYARPQWPMMTLGVVGMALYAAVDTGIALLVRTFLDGTFVATSNLRTVMSGEKFDLALGADEGISVKHKRLNKFTEDTGLTGSGKRITYEYLITIQNNKRSTERVNVADQLPVSRNEKIVVKQIQPDSGELKPTPEGYLKWTLDLKPGEKRELTVKFTVDYPKDVDVTGLE